MGTERGNTHIVNIESFILSGYVIMWNKAIELWVSKAANAGADNNSAKCYDDDKCRFLINDGNENPGIMDGSWWGSKLILTGN